MSTLRIVPVTGKEIERRAAKQQGWLLEPYLGPGLITCVWSDPGDWKSTLATDLAYSVAAGAPFGDLQTTAAGVLYFVEDNARTVNWRRKSSLAGRGRQSERVNYWPSIDHFRGGSAVFQDEDGNEGAALPEHMSVQGVMEAYVAWHRERFKDLPVLFVIDTAAHFLNIEDGTGLGEVTRILRPIRNVLEDSGAALYLIHHSNRRGGYGGSIAWVGQVDIFLHQVVQNDDSCWWRKDKDGKQREDEVPDLCLRPARPVEVDPALLNQALEFLTDNPDASQRAFEKEVGGDVYKARAAFKEAKVRCIAPPKLRSVK